jgi:cytidyltransferase-like protein
MNNKIGFTIGKFAPLHKGHQLLIETALSEMDKFYVVIYETDLINVDVEKRANWIRKLYPQVEILIAKNPPKQYGLDEKSVEIQMKYLIEILGDIKPTHFYSSELYGKCVAEYLGIIDRRVDNEKNIVPISATKIRNDLKKYKEMLPEFIYAELEKNYILPHV